MQPAILLCLFLVATLTVDIVNTKEVKKKLGTVIGIDLGTTYSCVAIFKNCHVEIIDNDQGHRITPSYVTFTSDGERLIGDAAKNLLTSNPRSTIISFISFHSFLCHLDTIFQVKRLIGRQFNDSSVQEDIKHFPFAVVEKDGRPILKINTDYGEKMYTPEEISAMILSKMRVIAVRFFKQEIDGNCLF